MNNDDDTLTCLACCQTAPLDDYEVLGACRENMFCPECGAEVDQAGMPQLLCGKCSHCAEFKDTRVFGQIQKERRHMRKKVQERLTRGGDVG